MNARDRGVIIITVANLPPVPSETAHLFALLGVVDGPLGEFDVFLLPFQLVEENVPDLAPLFGREVRVVDDDMNARDKGIVKGADAVGGEEQQPLIIL